MEDKKDEKLPEEEIKKEEEAKPQEETEKEETEEVKEDEEEVVEDLIDENLEKIKQLEATIVDLKNKYAMAYADTENTRKRLQAEAEQSKKYRIQSFALEILPVIDNLERALASDENKKDEGFYKGVSMIKDQLMAALSKEGVSEIECLDQKFDSNYHQAVMQEKVDGKESGIVIEVLQKGYMLKDRILRPAMVKVSE